MPLHTRAARTFIHTKPAVPIITLVCISTRSISRHKYTRSRMKHVPPRPKVNAVSWILNARCHHRNTVNKMTLKSHGALTRTADFLPLILLQNLSNAGCQEGDSTQASGIKEVLGLQGRLDIAWMTASSEKVLVFFWLNLFFFTPDKKNCLTFSRRVSLNSRRLPYSSHTTHGLLIQTPWTLVTSLFCRWQSTNLGIGEKQGLKVCPWIWNGDHNNNIVRP